ncbi:bifunctional acetate--CoA ligase family protein/GNAT family N-acetyltransferase [Tundrisphaera lichenicola]|uniref:bifunctional acetate--CoA ligase family protein/GNAT family N-acetyltransferase n=1 Tax=Tundrisphaera lichenicola TaxID=2029860 RepID=UPI003EBE5D97
MPTTPPQPTPGSDVYRSGRKPLDAIFEPRSVAVIGASERPGSVGRTILRNLIDNPFGGTVYPVNPNRKNVLGIRAYPSVKDVPEPVDLAVIVTPAATVPDLMGECADAGVKGAIVISAGFKETGPEGIELEFRVLEQARRGRIRLIGPNCLGVMRPHVGLNATFAGLMAVPGNVGFLSQSGALTTAILDWSLKAHVGFSAFVSIGSMLDVGWGDLIDYLGDDPRTHSIVIYMESVGDARSFLSAAREVALTKPIIVIKAGRTEAAAKAAASHTGSLAGSDEVLDAAFRRGGVLRVNTIADVFSLAEVLAKQPRPAGPRLTIVTNAGGPGVLAVDSLIGNNGQLAELSPESIAALDGFLPHHWSHGNPVDVLGDADPARFARALEVAAKDPGSDGLLVILTPQAMTDPTGTAEALKPYAKVAGKPVLASWMGGAQVAAGEEILDRAGIPTFAYPDTAARVFTAMARHAANLRALYETPTLPPESDDEAEAKARGDVLLQAALDEGRTLLDEFESKQLLAAHGLPTVETRVATDEEQAVEAAEAIGYPVVVKLYSRVITHKTEFGGVRLNLVDAYAVREAFRNIAASVDQMAPPGAMLGVTVQPMVRLEGLELIVGSSIDTQFGPVLLFGSGGRLVEVYRDRSLALPPLTSTLARRLMERTRIFEALKGVRGRKPVDLEALEQLLVRFSRMIVERPRIKEVDINPLLASPEGLLALDARVILHGPDVPDDKLPRPAIRPYPTRYVTPWVTKEGSPVVIRPIRAEDEPLLVKFHETLSERSVALRYFHPIKLSRRVAHDRLTRICFNDYDREMALVVDRKEPWAGTHEILGVGRLSKIPGSTEAEFALLVGDHHQARGIGSELLRRLLAIARDESITRVTAEILADNREMQRVCEKLGFQLERSIEDSIVRAAIDLTKPPEPAPED